MNKSVKYATVAFGVFSLMLVAVFGAYTLWSNIVQEDVSDFSLTLSSSSMGVGVTLSGTLLDGSQTAVSGATISLWEVANMNGDLPHTFIHNVTTTAQGTYSYWFPESVGIHCYRASYDVP